MRPIGGWINPDFLWAFQAKASCERIVPSDECSFAGTGRPDSLLSEARETADTYNQKMSKALTARERAHLKARAHALEPVVQAGSSGVTDTLVAEIDRALTAHELIKVKVGAADREARVGIGDEICARTGAAAVHRVGKVLILWRPRPENAQS